MHLKAIGFFKTMDASTTVMIVFALGVVTGWLIFSALGGLGDVISVLSDALK